MADNTPDRAASPVEPPTNLPALGSYPTSIIQRVVTLMRTADAYAWDAGGRDKTVWLRVALEREIAAELAPPVEPVAPSLHNAIMNLPYPAGVEDMKTDHRLTYKSAFRDARHAAAELANEYASRQTVAPAVKEPSAPAPSAAPAEPVAYCDYCGRAAPGAASPDKGMK
jgi:hypothetical protein